MTVDRAVETLNEIHAADATVLPALIKYRVPCNRALGDHPTVQVGLREGADKDDHDTGYEVGLLGILNGIFGIMPDSGSGYIAAHYDDDHVLTHFVNLAS